MIEFQAFPKIPRLNRDCTISEKIDGTNAAVVVVESRVAFACVAGAYVLAELGGISVLAQSRTRFITPGKTTDNYGYAGWVTANAAALVDLLGPGTHYGEWWGQGIRRGYGLSEKRFSLFNADRYEDAVRNEYGDPLLPGLDIVPVLYQGRFHSDAVADELDDLMEHGSAAAPGYMRPEGVVVFHHAARQTFKVLCEGDAVAKSAALLTAA